MPDRDQLAAELEGRLQPLVSRMRRERRLATLAGSLRPAILIAAALAAERAVMGEPGPLEITALSFLPALWGILFRRRRIDIADAAAVIDRHADLKDRIVTAVAHCGREEWAPLVAWQVEDAVARLAQAALPLGDRRPLVKLAARGGLLAALLALVWIWPFGGVGSPGVAETADGSVLSAPRPRVAPDAAALANSYREFRSAELPADPSGQGRQPADAAVARCYFEKVAQEAAAP